MANNSKKLIWLANLVMLGGIGTFLVISCAQKVVTKKDKQLLERAQTDFETLPENDINVEENEELIKLGKKLYFEKKLSVNNEVSCNTCHDLKNYGVDNEPTSPGHDGTRGPRNSPTVYNSSLHIAQFWDGREPDVESQALGPILNPIEMGMPSEEAVEKKVKKLDEYTKLFQEAFPKQDEPVKFKNIGKAIGAYERTLLTPSRFDEYLEGDVHALTSEERKGLKTFMEVGCTTCHNGAGVGGNSYQKLGLVNEFETEDLGRHEHTGEELDKKFFKVPSLRNVEETYPYFHDGSVKTLDEAIELMAFHQLDVELDKQQVKEIRTFLGALTAESPEF